MKASVDARWAAFVSVGEDSQCWLWNGAKSTDGYGFFSLTHRQLVRAHRYSYELFMGTIPEGLQIDHLCRVVSCVNPLHLDVVTSRQNTLRGFGPTAQNSRKMFCPLGHQLSGSNLYVRPNGKRCCRTCRKAQRIVPGLRGEDTSTRSYGLKTQNRN